MADTLPVDSLLVSLPSSAFCNHIYTALTEEDRKALRLACKGSRLLVNDEVTGARISGSTLRTSAGGTNLTLQRVVETCPQLTSLAFIDTQKEYVCVELLEKFFGCEHVDDQGCSSVFKFGDRIQNLDVKQCNFLKAVDLQRLFYACARLRNFRASRWADASHLRALASPIADSLIELDLGDSCHNILTINDKSLAYLPRLPALRSLSLKRCVEVSDAGVAQLGATRLPNLTSLDLTSTRVTGISGFDAPASELRSLVLQGCRAFGDAGLAAVCGRHASSLRALYLHGTAVQHYGASLRHLAQVTGLEVLDLGTAWEVDTEGLAALSRCCSLTDLRLGNFNLRRSGSMPQPALHDGLDRLGGEAAAGGGAAAAAAPAAAVGSLPNLARLSLGGMYCQQGLLLLLRGLPRLRRLELAGLDTARDGVLAQLAASGGGAAAALQELYIARGGPDLTAGGLMRLAALPALRHLTLVDCPAAATAATVQQLVQAVRSAGRQLRVEVVVKPNPAIEVEARRAVA
ncbi:hypothetical protein PLESTF_000531200 [Pleodorina starrii]|nr:hypothetical protein PLESTF_000531200 [Pleodorina starrii]